MAVAGRYPMVPLNSTVRNIQDLASVPIRLGTNPTVFIRDVGTVTDGSDIVTSYALIDGCLWPLGLRSLSSVTHALD
jgi:multidrug efflux pump subunit AcrB